jgi:hypothetical protein
LRKTNIFQKFTRSTKNLFVQNKKIRFMILNDKADCQVSTILMNPRPIYVKRSENDSPVFWLEVWWYWEKLLDLTYQNFNRLWGTTVGLQIDWKKKENLNDKSANSVVFSENNTFGILSEFFRNVKALYGRLIVLYLGIFSNQHQIFFKVYRNSPQCSTIHHEKINIPLDEFLILLD